ncbi:MAG TPA: hypothetical protein VFD91_07445 [Mariniphaga sp.]|nr:hypothetical protein [Mariniphaga sp.]
MKQSILSLSAVFLFLIALPAMATEEEKTNETAAVEATTEIAMEVKTHIDRLGEIKAMDFSELTSSEKKELRKEVRAINKDLKAYSKADSEARANADATAQGSQTGIYISGSAIIIILLLLLLL